MIKTRLNVVVPEQQEQEKQLPRWSIFGRPVFPSDMFPPMKSVVLLSDIYPTLKTEEEPSLPSPLTNILNEVANFFSSARYGITKEVEMKEMEEKEMETKVSDLMKDLE